jgi:pimeloyl-ACP methyl ester carboxylesterase
VSGLLVFIPGFLDNAALWRGVIDRLALPGWQSVPVNLRSTGGAEPRRDLIDIGLQSLTVCVRYVFHQPRDRKALQA